MLWRRFFKKEKIARQAEVRKEKVKNSREGGSFKGYFFEFIEELIIIPYNLFN